MPTIEVSHITKEYRLGAMQGLRQSLLNTAARLTGRHIEERPLFKALDDVSFTIEQGEVVGIIGHNGAGKSTLLKMLAGISKPTRGQVKVNGRIAPLIEVGAGFVPDFTGRENVYLNGSIMGLSRQEIDKKFDEIVEFAEMAEFIDTPVKRYSSGMQVKLAFSVATSIDAEILIVDEVLAVGDLAFQRKCFDRMENLIKRQGRTVLLVSHNIRQVERLCSRVVLLDHGTVLEDGESRKVCDIFFARNDEKVKNETANRMAERARRESTGDIELLQVVLQDQKGNGTERIEYKSEVMLSILYKNHKPIINPIFGIGVHTVDFLYLATEISEHQFEGVQLGPGIFEVKFHIQEFPLLPGVYSIRLGVTEGEIKRTIFYQESVLNFQVELHNRHRTQAMQEGFISIDGEWLIDNTPKLSAFKEI
jgi:lipopolysaccharide transport system ATP-binding protein